MEAARFLGPLKKKYQNNKLAKEFKKAAKDLEKKRKIVDADVRKRQMEVSEVSALTLIFTFICHASHAQPQLKGSQGEVSALGMMIYVHDVLHSYGMPLTHTYMIGTSCKRKSGSGECPCVDVLHTRHASHAHT